MQDQFETLYQDMIGLLDGLGSTMSDDNASEVREFLENNEFGLALETLCQILTEEKITIKRALLMEIDRIGNRMGLNERVWADIAIDRLK